MQCVNNLKQVGLGIMATTSPTTTARPRPIPFWNQGEPWQPTPTSARMSECSVTSTNSRSTTPPVTLSGCWNNVVSEQINSTVSRTKLATFLCPSDTPPSFGIYAGDSLPIPSSGDPTAPGTNYQGSYGSNMEFNATMTGSPPNGVFQFSTGQVIGLQAVTDGTSNTAAYGECLVRNGQHARRSIPVGT